ncbi:MAG: ABC transporter substrate-binding protein [Dehalococcoidia bacterium]
MATRSYWHRFRRVRISRRRLVGAAGLGAAGLAVAAACGGGDGEETPVTGETPTAVATPEAGTPKRGGRYKGVTTVDWGTLDPVTSAAGFTGITARIYNALMARSTEETDFVFMDLAEELEQPDKETYLFRIRPGVKIGPNDYDIEERDLDALDAKVWQDRIAEDENALPRSFTLPWLVSYDAPDARTFIMKTKGPYAYFTFRTNLILGGLMPPREFWEQGISLEGGGVGAGPYTIRQGSYHETGGIILDRNPNYYRTDPDNNDARLPYYDGIDVARITDRLARRTAFQDGQIYNYGAQDKSERDELLRQNPDYFVTEEGVNTFISFTMNPTRPPWDDDRIRKAAMFALNRQQFADRIFGEGGAKPNGLIHWPLGPFALDPEELEELQPYDPARSRQLIQDATGEDTIKIKVMYPTGVDIFYHADHLLIWRQQMQEAGFELDEEALDLGSWLGRYTVVDYDSSFSLNQVYDLPDTTLNFHHSLGVQGDENFGIGVGALYPEVDDAIQSSKETASLEEAAERVKEAQRLIYEKGPAFLPIVSWLSYSLSQPFVKNITPGLRGAGQFLNNTWLDL